MGYRIIRALIAVGGAWAVMAGGQATVLVRRAYYGLPPRLRADLDYTLLRWRSFEPFGGPFNNQLRRQEAILELITAYRPDRIIETGTFRGSTTAYLARHFDGPIDSVEINPHFYFFARRRLKRFHRVSLALADSVDFLKTAAGRPGSADERTVFYLDAHWSQRLPLKEELAVIFGHWRSAIVAIDDFEVPGQPGYKFDDYGPGQRLSLELFEATDLPLKIFFPKAPAESETGERRGCAVVTRPGENAALLHRLSGLKQYVGGGQIARARRRRR